MKTRSHTIYIGYIALFFGFLLGTWEGKIALWQNGCPDPHVFPYEAASLPAADQLALEKGIYIVDAADLQALLQDYLS